MTTVKGLLKGLRYISQIFENEKKEEFEIGLPTDVKHVAHIGNDGPSANSPSWKNEFQSSSEPAPGEPISNGNATTSSARDSPFGGTIETQRALDAPLDSPTQRSSGKIKQARRHGHARTSSTDSVGSACSVDSIGSPARESSGISKPRRHKHSSCKNSSIDSPKRQQNSSTGFESSSHDPNVPPKPSRRKKSKDGSTDGGSRMSRRKAVLDPVTESFPYPDSGPVYDKDSGEICQKSVFEKYEEGKDCEEISRGIRAL